MDSAKFIRRRRVFAMWVSIPLLLTAIIYFNAHSFNERQKLKFEQAQTLERVIPQMALASEDFDRFITPYKIGKNTRRSVEDENIELLNKSAEKANVTINSINLAQKVLDPETGTIQMSLQVVGSGSDRGLAEFLSHIRAKDPYIYEEQVTVSSTGGNKIGFQIEATLTKVYIEHPEGVL